MNDSKYELIALFGKPALFSNTRLREQDIPSELYLYHIRGRDDDFGQFATIEPKVGVNHAGSVITDEPIDFGEDGYIAFDDENSPAFLGYSISIEDYMNGEFEPDESDESPCMLDLN